MLIKIIMVEAKMYRFELTQKFGNEKIQILQNRQSKQNIVDYQV